jgi:hypothetical protein
MPEMPGSMPLVASLWVKRMYQISKLLPDAKILAIHMEALNHCGLSRTGLRDFAAAKGFGERLYIPADGEVLAL